VLLSSQVCQEKTLRAKTATDAQPWASECPDVKNYKWLLNPVCMAQDAL